MDRKLASIQQIIDLQPVPGADRIELASVLGWKCVVDRGQFHVGDKAVYFEIDSMIPAAPWNDRFRKEAMDKPLRIKTRKFRGSISQGLCFDLSILPPLEYGIGDDVTAVLNVEKYEPAVPAELDGQVKGNFPTAYIKKTDAERIENCKAIIAECIERGLEMVGTLKCDGASMTAGVIPYPNSELGKLDREFVVCSRNINLKESDTNSFWKMAKHYNLAEKLLAMPEDYVLQMELIGNSIRKNRMGITGLDVRVFNVKNITTGKFLDHDDAVAFCASIDVPFVPTIVRRTFTTDDSIESIFKFVDALNYDSGHPAEGIVWKSAKETCSEVLRGENAL